MGEHLPCTQGVRSSSLLISTNNPGRDCDQGNGEVRGLRVADDNREMGS